MLQVRIRKRLGNFQLDVEWETEERLALLGASGAGKSVTLQCIAGIQTPDEGLICLNGRTLFDSRRRVDVPVCRRKVGFLFQNYALFPNMTVEGNVRSGLAGSRRDWRRADVSALLRRFRLEGLERKYPTQLSGGQQQRTALARMLASQPEALLLDEPFSALDTGLRWELEQELRTHLADFPGPAVLVTHDREEAYRLCGEMAVMAGGEIQVRGPRRQVLAQPGTRSAARLLGCENLSSLERRSDGKVWAVQWGVPVAPPRPAEAVGLPARALRAAPGPGEGRLLCRVTSVVETPHQAIVLLEGQGGESLRWETGEPPAPGQQLWMELPARELLWLDRDA
ncbi:MAG: sulfate/molybdate ABC transporter ATP-binding protein [Eubacteriales bacterium]|jgi:molybdate transport system ATP-binding protein